MNWNLKIVAQVNLFSSYIGFTRHLYGNEELPKNKSQFYFHFYSLNFLPGIPLKCYLCIIPTNPRLNYRYALSKGLWTRPVRSEWSSKWCVMMTQVEPCQNPIPPSPGNGKGFPNGGSEDHQSFPLCVTTLSPGYLWTEVRLLLWRLSLLRLAKPVSFSSSMLWFWLPDQLYIINILSLEEGNDCAFSVIEPRLLLAAFLYVGLCYLTFLHSFTDPVRSISEAVQSMEKKCLRYHFFKRKILAYFHIYITRCLRDDIQFYIQDSFVSPVHHVHIAWGGFYSVFEEKITILSTAAMLGVDLTCHCNA